MKKLTLAIFFILSISVCLAQNDIMSRLSKMSRMSGISKMSRGSSKTSSKTSSRTSRKTSTTKSITKPSPSPSTSTSMTMDMGSHSDLEASPSAVKNFPKFLPFPDLSAKPIADNSIEPGVTATINGQLIEKVSKNIWMGLSHPALWDATHCVQVPFFPGVRKGASSRCKQKSGWYFNAAGNGNCEQITIPCDGMATLNLFTSLSNCTAMCFDRNGRGRKLIPTTTNLDPRATCIEQPVTTMGKSKRNKLIWAYDAQWQTCWEVWIPSDSATSKNAYASGAICQHMCHDVAPVGSGKGHSLHSMDDMAMQM